MSEDLEEIFRCINEAKVPAMWSKAYPSHKPLGSWTRDLVQRVDQVMLAIHIQMFNIIDNWYKSLSYLVRDFTHANDMTLWALELGMICPFLICPIFLFST